MRNEGRTRKRGQVRRRTREPGLGRRQRARQTGSQRETETDGPASRRPAKKASQPLGQVCLLAGGDGRGEGPLRFAHQIAQVGNWLQKGPLCILRAGPTGMAMCTWQYGLRGQRGYPYGYGAHQNQLPAAPYFLWTLLWVILGSRAEGKGRQAAKSQVQVRLEHSVHSQEQSL